MSQKKQLTFLEATAIITGYGIGGGIMTLPFLTTKTGLPVMFTLLGLGFFISWIMHLMIAEIIIRDGDNSQMVELFQKYILKNRPAIFTWIIFILIAFAFLASLSAYIAGGGKIIADIFGLPLIAGQSIFYAVASGVVFFGLKALGMSEKYGVFIILSAVLVFMGGCFSVPFSLKMEVLGGANNYLKLFGMIMFSFFAIFSVPQVAEGLDHNRKLIPRAITLGIAINAVVIFAIIIMTTGVSQAVDEVAIITLGASLGRWASITGSVFIIFAMLTSYWSVAYALATVVEERLKIAPRPSWLIATLPSLALVLVLSKSFLDFMELAGGAIALIVAFMVMPLYNAVRKSARVTNPDFKLTTLGTVAFQALVVIGYIAMAIGSVLPK